MVKKVNDIDTIGLAKKANYNATINAIKRKIPSKTGLATTVALNAEITIGSDFVSKIFRNDQKILDLSLNVLPHLIIINLQMKYLMER